MLYLVISPYLSTCVIDSYLIPKNTTYLCIKYLINLMIFIAPGIGGFIAQTLEEQLLRWLRSAELTCDRAALLVTKDPKVKYFDFSALRKSVVCFVTSWTSLL